MNTIMHNFRLGRVTAITVALAATGASAVGLTVNVSGVQSETGEIGCALFANPHGFPLDIAAARQVWLTVRKPPTDCSFTAVPAGRYAVSVVHDLNGNRRVDTSFIGIPNEPWGVSNNVRPTLRPPQFWESAFDVSGETPSRVKIRVAR